jgi:CPA1 family monovalent cation:H+ antiporter
VLADDLFGVSGVMAAVGAGLVIRYLGETRTDAEVREVWGRLWECLGYVANAILFLLIGLAIEPGLIGEHAGAIALAIVVVLVSRAIAVVPLVSALERLAHIPPVGRRNEAVLVWGGLRAASPRPRPGAPEALEERDMFVAMTGGVVLATLLVNATTIGTLVRRLGLDQPSPGERYLAAVAGSPAWARRAMRSGPWRSSTSVPSAGCMPQSGRRRGARTAGADAAGPARRPRAAGLFVERQAYQHLSDEGLVSDTSARKLLAEVDEAIEEVSLQRRPGPRQDSARLERLIERVVVALPDPVTESADELALSEATARRVAAGRSREGLDVFAGLPGIDAEALEEARAEFARREREAEQTLAEVGRRPGADHLRERQVEAIAHLSSRDALSAVAATGLLPTDLAERAALDAGSTVGEGKG